MKKIILVLVSALLFIGCAGSSRAVKVGNGVVPSDIEVEALDVKNGYLFNLSTIGYEKKFRKTIKVASTFGKSKGFKYMAIINDKINNLNGFPINNVETMVRYINLDHKGHYRPFVFGKGFVLLKGKDIYLRVVYFKQKIPGVFLWDLSKI